MSGAERTEIRMCEEGSDRPEPIGGVPAPRPLTTTVCCGTGPAEATLTVGAGRRPAGTVTGAGASPSEPFNPEPMGGSAARRRRGSASARCFGKRAGTGGRA